MNKMITIYELLGLVKDGKAPKKIKYNGKIYIYYEAYAGYYEENHQGEYTKKFLTFRNEQYHKVLNETIEILEEENKEFLANNLEFHVDDSKTDLVITLNENDLGIDKLHFDNCYFFKDNDGKWYVRKYEFKKIEEENKIEKLYHCCMESDNEEIKFLIKNINDLSDKFNEVIDEINKLKEDK